MAVLGKDLRAAGWAVLAVLAYLAGQGQLVTVDFGAPQSSLEGWSSVEHLTLALAIGLGAWLAWNESLQGTWPLLLTRPVRRAWVLAGKLATGLAALVPVALVALLLLRQQAHGARLEGPFDPTLLIAPERRLMLLVPWYLTAFLCGLPYRAHPVGRWLPLGAMVLVQQRVLGLAWPQPRVAAVVAGLSALLLLAAATARVDVDA